MNRWLDKSERDKRCTQKDQVITPILESVPIRHPKKFKAILMPCAHAPELRILDGAGVPNKNIVAIERDGAIWGMIKRDLGLQVGHAPMDANRRMDYIHAEHPGGFDLIYLDFFGQVTSSHLNMIEKIMAFKMLRPGARLILNFAKGRTSSENAALNRMVSKRKDPGGIPTQTYIEIAVKMYGHKKPSQLSDHKYESTVGNNKLIYVTTDAHF